MYIPIFNIYRASGLRSTQQLFGHTALSAFRAVEIVKKQTNVFEASVDSALSVYNTISARRFFDNEGSDSALFRNPDVFELPPAFVTCGV